MNKSKFKNFVSTFNSSKIQAKNQKQIQTTANWNFRVSGQKHNIHQTFDQMKNKKQNKHLSLFLKHEDLSSPKNEKEGENTQQPETAKGMTSNPISEIGRYIEATKDETLELTNHDFDSVRKPVLKQLGEDLKVLRSEKSQEKLTSLPKMDPKIQQNAYNKYKNENIQKIVKPENEKRACAQSPLIDIIVYSVLQDEKKKTPMARKSLEKFKEYQDNKSPDQKEEPKNRFLIISKSQKHFDKISFQEGQQNISSASSDSPSKSNTKQTADKASYMNKYKYNQQRSKFMKKSSSAKKLSPSTKNQEKIIQFSQKRLIQSKIKYFQNWLAGNHLKNVKKQLDFDRMHKKKILQQIESAPIIQNLNINKDLFEGNIESVNITPPLGIAEEQSSSEPTNNQKVGKVKLVKSQIGFYNDQIEPEKIQSSETETRSKTYIEN